MENGTGTASDMEIVLRVVGGDINAYEQLLTKYKQYVLQIVARHLPQQFVEETAHDVFVRAYQALPGINSRTAFKAWLATIAIRTCHDFWRKRYRTRELPISSLTDDHQEWLNQVMAADSARDLAEKGRQQEARELLEWGLAQLSPDDRLVLELVYFEERSGKEAARLLGLSIANVKIRVFRARNRLKKVLRARLQSER
jgi:RNA polymerase sigma-70 factor (ECF subfamily)